MKSKSPNKTYIQLLKLPRQQELSPEELKKKIERLIRIAKEINKYDRIEQEFLRKQSSRTNKE